MTQINQPINQSALFKLPLCKKLGKPSKHVSSQEYLSEKKNNEFYVMALNVGIRRKFIK
jgi:hypothetical protein